MGKRKRVRGRVRVRVRLGEREGVGEGRGRNSRGQPLITIVKIVIPRNTALTWHHHPIISAAYVLSGQIILEKKETRERRAFHAGQALAETVNTIHRGYTTDQPTE